MRTLFTVVCFLLALSIAQANEIIYALQVDGLSCPFCVYGIEKRLSAIDGVDNIEVDLNKGLVLVTMKQANDLSKKQAQQAVEDAGFTLRAFNQKNPDNRNAPGE
jgi:copper chaperone CopZ